MYDFQILLEKVTGEDKTVRVVIYDVDSEYNSKSIHDIIEQEVTSKRSAMIFAEFVQWRVYDNDYTILHESDYDFGRARTMKGKLAKAIEQMAFKEDAKY